MITDSYKINSGSGGLYFLSSFGDWLRSARLAKGFSTTDLADAAGVTQPLITAYENGKRNPKRDTVEKIAKALSGEGDSYSRVLAKTGGGSPPPPPTTKEIETMEETQTTDTEKPEFHIDSESSADWLLRKLLHLDAEKATIATMAAQRVAEIEADKSRLMGRFGAELEAWARGEAERRRRQTVTLSYGSVSFRKVPARLAIESEADAITTARAVLPQAIQTVEHFDKAAYLAHAKATLETTGELLPGVGQSEARTSFSIKFTGKSHAAPEEPPTD